MKKNIKHIVYVSLFVLTFLYLNTVYTNASIKNRFYNILGNTCNNCITFYDVNNYFLRNLKIAPGVEIESKIFKLIEDELISGIDIEDFDLTNVASIFNNNYYFQNLTEEGDKITLISKEKPTIINIDGDMVKIKFTNPFGIYVEIETKGIPIWLKGKDILKKINEIKTLNDSCKINCNYISKDSQCTMNNNKDEFNLYDILPNYFANSEELNLSNIFLSNEIMGVSIYKFDFTDLEEIIPSFWYHQYKNDKGKTITVISNKLPEVSYRIGKNASETFQHINWLSGNLLLKEKKRRENNSL